MKRLKGLLIRWFYKPKTITSAMDYMIKNHIKNLTWTKAGDYDLQCLVNNIKIHPDISDIIHCKTNIAFTANIVYKYHNTTFDLNIAEYTPKIKFLLTNKDIVLEEIEATRQRTLKLI